MPADRSDLAARLAATTREDTIRGLAFNSAFDVVREHADEATILLCDPTGKGKRSDFISYPVADFLGVLWAVADRLERKVGGPDEVFFQVGYRATAGVLGSMLGHTLLTFGRTPKAVMTQVPTAFKATAGYGQRFVTWQGERHATVEFEREFLPVAYLRGALRAGLDATGATNPVVEAQDARFMRVVFDVTWG